MIKEKKLVALSAVLPVLADFIEDLNNQFVFKQDLKRKANILADEIRKVDYKVLQVYGEKRDEIYDAWASRITDKDEGWPPGVAVEGFPKRMDVWSTFNCFCKYNAEPMKNNISFSGFNKRLNKYDCDTAVICENFREAGYNKIVLDGRYSVFHSRYN